MAVVNKFNVNSEQVTLDADIIENMSANDVSYDNSFQYDENTVGDKLSELKKDVAEVIGEDLILSTTGGGDEWRSVVFNVDESHPYTLKIEGITDVSNEGTLFVNIYTTTNGVRLQKYYVKHGETISPSYSIPENTTIVEVYARFHTDETMLATLSYEGDLNSIEKKLSIIQTILYDELPFILGTIYDGQLDESSKDCLSCLKYIEVKPNQIIIFKLGDSLKVRISEYDSEMTFIKYTGYDIFTSLMLGSTTSFIRVSLNYNNRGYNSENPITIEAYSAGDFMFYDETNSLKTQQNELKKILLGKQDIINGTRNLYNPSTAIDGYLNKNGIVIKGDVKVTDFIYCYGKKQITTNYTGRPTIYLCFYDENKNFLSSVLQHNIYTFDIPDIAVYFRASMSAYTSTNMIVFGDTIPEYEPYIGIDDIISQLKLITEKENSVISFNEDKGVALAALRNAVPNTYSYPNRNFFPLFSIATDIHSDWDRLKRVLEYSEEVGVNSILCLGDIGDQQGAFDGFDWQNFVLGASIPVLTIPGNHEFVYNAGQTFYTGYTDETLAAKIYNEELVVHNGETHPNGKNYWHKDISYSVRGEDKILRIIGVYQFEFVDAWEDGHPVHTQGTTGKDMPYYKQEQIDWLVGLLDSVDSNTDVVILMHHAPTNNLERVNNTWNPAQSLGINIISGVSNNTNNDFIPQIIDAWINGTSVDTSSTMTNDNSVISVNHTFSSTHHGKFVGYITGHSHYDAITKIVGMEEQYVFCNICTTASDIQQGGDLPRSTSGKLQDSFNIIAYDCMKHRMGIVKIGSDISVDMRDKKYTCKFIVE